MNRRSLIASSVIATFLGRHVPAMAQTPEAGQWTDTAYRINASLANHQPVQVLQVLEAAQPMTALAKIEPPLATFPWHAQVDNVWWSATGFVIFADADGPLTAPDALSTVVGAIIICDSADIAYFMLGEAQQSLGSDTTVEYRLADGAQVVSVSNETLSLELLRINYAIVATVNHGATPEAIMSHLSAVLESM